VSVVGLDFSRAGANHSGGRALGRRQAPGHIRNRKETDVMQDSPADTAPPAPTPDATPRVVWNDADIQASFANVINVVNTREEFIFLFGTNRSWNPAAGQEWKVDLANRITMTPHGAKRMLLLLAQRVQDYEGRFGPIAIE
jgi:hypothetical protein